MSRLLKTGTIAKVLGLAPPLLRIWEARYGLVRPARGPGGQRLYSDDDLQLLRAVSTLTSRGYAVGEVASWSRATILTTAQRDQKRTGRGTMAPPVVEKASESVIITVDSDGVVHAVSPTVEGLLGWPHSLLVGQPIWGLLVDVPEPLERVIAGDVRPGTTTTCAVWMKTRSAGPIACRLTCGTRRTRTDGTSLTLTVAPLTVDGETPLSSLLQHVPAGGLARFDGGLTDVLRQYATTGVEQLQAALSRVWTYDAKDCTLHLVASAGLSKSVSSSSRSVIRVANYRYKVGVVARTGVPYVHNDLSGDHDFDRAWIRRERLESAAVLPLVRDGKLFGVSAQFFRRRLGGSDIGTIQTMARLCEASLRDPAPTRRSRRSSR